MNKPILSLFLLLLIPACKPAGSSDPEKPVISVSILSQQYFLESLAGDLVQVNVMIPPGASPATYEPTFSQLRNLEQSALYMRIGYIGFELSWMDKILSVNPDMEVADLSRGIDLIRGEDPEGHQHQGGEGGGTDPHIWMSVRNAKVISSNMYESLCSLVPSEKERFSSNLSKLHTRLDSLDQMITEMLAGRDHSSFMIYHPSLSYFARDYGLQQLAMEFEGKTPSPAHLKEMSDLGMEHHISTIFLQSQFDQKNAGTLAEEIGAEVVQINPLDPDWYNQMLFIASSLRKSL